MKLACSAVTSYLVSLMRDSRFTFQTNQCSRTAHAPANTASEPGNALPQSICLGQVSFLRTLTFILLPPVSNFDHVPSKLEIPSVSIFLCPKLRRAPSNCQSIAVSVLSLGYEDPEIRDYTLLMFVLIVHDCRKKKKSNDFSV